MANWHTDMVTEAMKEHRLTAVELLEQWLMQQDNDLNRKYYTQAHGAPVHVRTMDKESSGAAGKERAGSVDWAAWSCSSVNANLSAR